MQTMNHPMPFPTIAMPMRHAFCVVGTETIFLCHQIMSHMEGHNCEFVFEAELPANIKKQILEDRLAGQSHWIANQDDEKDSNGNVIEKHTMTLAEIKAGNLTSFKADAWNAIPDKHNPPNAPWGDPEDPDVDPWLANFEVKVKRIVHYRHVNLNVTSRIHEQYLLFGKGNEAHIYHSLIWQPEYGHVASLTEKPEWISTDQLEASIMISIPDLPWKKDQTYDKIPLESGKKYRVLSNGINNYFNPDGTLASKVPDYYITIATTYWFSIWIINFFNIDLYPDSKQICEPS